MGIFNRIFGRRALALSHKDIPRLEQQHAVFILIDAVRSGNPVIRRRAAYALKRIGAPRAYGPLLEQFLVYGREGSFEREDIRYELEEIGVTDDVAYKLLQKIRKRARSKPLKHRADWVIGHLRRQNMTVSDRKKIIDKLKKSATTHYKIISNHPGEFAGLLPDEQYDVLKAVYPDYPDTEIKKVLQDTLRQIDF